MAKFLVAINGLEAADPREVALLQVEGEAPEVRIVAVLRNGYRMLLRVVEDHAQAVNVIFDLAEEIWGDTPTPKEGEEG